MPRTHDEQVHDAQMVALMRRCADDLDAIAGTLAAIARCCWRMNDE